MGNNNKSLQSPPSHSHIILDYKYCKVWIHKESRRQQIQEYIVQIPTDKQLQTYKSMFLLRMQQKIYPVTMYFRNEGNSSLMCGSNHFCSILIQRIPYRLCQFWKVPQSDCFDMMRICLEGYRRLKMSYGLFKIRSTMICFDSGLKLKIWHHTDLSFPVPEDPYCDTEQDMIKSIIESIENCGQNHIAIKFSYFLSKITTLAIKFENIMGLLDMFSKQNAERFGAPLGHETRTKESFGDIQKYLRQNIELGFERNVFNMKTDKSMKRKSRDSSQRSRSGSKFSFRSNKVIESSPVSKESSIYYGNSRVSQSAASNPKQFKLFSTIQNVKPVAPQLQPNTNSQTKYQNQISHYNNLSPKFHLNTRSPKLSPVHSFTVRQTQPHIRPTSPRQSDYFTWSKNSTQYDTADYSQKKSNKSIVSQRSYELAQEEVGGRILERLKRV